MVEKAMSKISLGYLFSFCSLAIIVDVFVRL